MKITLTPSHDQTGEEFPYLSVSIEIPDDDKDLPDILESLVEPALRAWGFSHLKKLELSYEA